MFATCSVCVRFWEGVGTKCYPVGWKAEVWWGGFGGRVDAPVPLQTSTVSGSGVLKGTDDSLLQSPVSREEVCLASDLVKGWPVVGWQASSLLDSHTWEGPLGANGEKMVR